MKTAAPDSDYGLGLSRIRLSCSTAWGHGGSVPGYTTLAFTSENGAHQAVVLINVSPTPAIGSRFERALGSAFCR
jgi:D-alanyl-D-alanine carboxypeptidase